MPNYKNVNDCMYSRPVAADLERWSNRMKIFSAITIIVILVMGIYTSWSVSYIEGSWYKPSEFHFGMFLLSMIPYALYSVVSFCVFSIASAILSALSGIYQYTAESAALKEYELRSKEENNQ